MPAGYAATTQVESTFGDHFTAEISDLRVAERLPWAPTGSPGTQFHLMPNPPFATPTPGPLTRRPSNIVPIRTDSSDPHNDVFYLGLDIEFVGTQIGQPGFPATVDVEVRFFMEAYGTASGALAGHRHEINIASQTFVSLNANPSGAPGDNELRHQLWVEVSEQNPGIIQAPPDIAWDDLFNPDTIYRVAAAVKISERCRIKRRGPDLTGFIEGLVMQTEEWNPDIFSTLPG